MRIVNDAVNDGGEMFRNADDQSSGRQFVRAQMDGTAGADLHRRRPRPAEMIHDSLDGNFVYAGARVTDPAFSFSGAFVGGGAVHQVIDFLIGALGGDGDRTDDAVPSFAFVSGSQSAAVVESEMSSQLPLPPLISVIRLILEF